MKSKHQFVGRRISRRILTAWYLVAVSLLPGTVGAADEIWINVDTRKRTLYVMEDQLPLRAFENISIGRNGVTRDKRADDEKTPLGRYRVRWVNSDSRFHRFFGLDYPNEKQAEDASRVGHISNADHVAIVRAHQRGREPPADTPLGGSIGIHGIGDGDPRVHQSFNWTEGCVALTDEQVDELSGWIALGTVVVIQ